MVKVDTLNDDSGSEYEDTEEGLAYRNGTAVEKKDNDSQSGSSSQSAASQLPTSDWADIMTKHWNENDGRAISQNSPEFRELQGVASELNSWYLKNQSKSDIWDVMEKITPDGGVRVRIISHGSKKTPIVPGMLFSMQYTGFLEREFTKPVDATRFRGRREVYRYSEEEPFVHGLFLAIGDLSLGDFAHVRITPEYAFGAAGVPPRIPPYAFLHYVLEIRDEEISDQKASVRFIRQPDDVKGALGFETCKKAAVELREKGVAAFRKQQYMFAQENFEHALNALNTCEKLLEDPSEAVAGEFDAVLALALAVRRNCAVVYAKRQSWKDVKKICRKILDMYPSDAKGIYYSALANFSLGKDEKAMQQIQEGIRLYPKMPEYSELYKKLKSTNDKHLENERLMCKRMFHSANKESTDKWALVGKEVREHIADEIKKMLLNVNLVEIPLKFGYFTDKTNLAYLEKEAEKAGLGLSVSEGKRRMVVRLQRKAKSVA